MIPKINLLKRSFPGLLLLVIAVASIALSLEKQRPRASLSELSAFANVDDRTVLRPFMLGYETTVASMVWISAVMEFADILLSKKPTTLIHSEIWSVVQLDTVWQYPYEFAGMAFEDERRRPDSTGVKILDLGLRRFPENARFAILYAQLIQRAYWLDSTTRIDSAAKVMLPLASGRIVAPDYARTLGLTLLAKGGNAALAIRQTLYLWENEKSPLLGHLFSEKLPDLLRQDPKIPTDEIETIAEGVRFIMQTGDSTAATLANDLILQVQSDSTREGALHILRRARELGSAPPGKIGTR